MSQPKYLSETAPNAAQELAVGNLRASQLLTPAHPASGTVTYTINFVAAQTVTINGVVFTAVAAGATGNQFNIGVDLATSLTNLQAKIAASVDPKLVNTVLTSVSATVLTVTAALAGAKGNTIPLAASIGTVVALAGGLDGARFIDLAKNESHVYSTPAGVLRQIPLDNGNDGQEITILLAVKGASANLQVNGTFLGGTHLTFSAADQIAHLKFLNGKWYPFYNTAAIS